PGGYPGSNVRNIGERGKSPLDRSPDVLVRVSRTPMVSRRRDIVPVHLAQGNTKIHAVLRGCTSPFLLKFFHPDLEKLHFAFGWVATNSATRHRTRTTRIC